MLDRAKRLSLCFECRGGGCWFCYRFAPVVLNWFGGWGSLHTSITKDTHRRSNRPRSRRQGKSHVLTGPKVARVSGTDVCD